MSQTLSDSTGVTATVAGPDLVTVSHPDGRTEQVPLDAAIALEIQKTGWRRDTAAQITQLEADKAALQQEIDDLKAANAAEADTKRGRKPAAAKADEADTTQSEED